MSIHIYQIVYSEESKGLCDPGFEQLDNLSNERPDWREYWAIRTYLNSHPLDDESLYGFFSPKFRQKTGLTSGQVIEFIRANDAGHDVFLFSPCFDQIAYYQNVFQQADAYRPGMMESFVRVFDSLGLDSALSTMITCSKNSVFSNYFVARPSFWRQWFEITEQIFRIAENGEHPLYGELNAGTEYNALHTQVKVFIIERIVSYVLQRYDLRKIKACSLVNSLSIADMAKSSHGELLVMDAMKICFLEFRNSIYFDLYQQIRRLVDSRPPA